MDRITVLYLVLANLFWAGNYVVGQLLMGDMSPYMLTWLRWALALLIFVPLAIIEKPSWEPIRQQFWKILFLSVTGVSGYAAVLYLALSYTSPIQASLINAANPAVIMLMSVFLLREKITVTQSLGLFLSLLGVLLILTHGSLQQLLHFSMNIGDLLMLLDIVMWSAYSIVAKRIKAVPVMTLSSITSLLGIIIMAPIAWSHAQIDWNLESMLGLLYVVLFPSVGSYVLWSMALARTEASRAGVFLNLLPVFTAFISIALGQPLTWFHIIGGFIVLTGVWLTGKKAPPAIPGAGLYTGR